MSERNRRDSGLGNRDSKVRGRVSGLATGERIGASGSNPPSPRSAKGRLGGISEPRRLAYLQAMGIDVWVPREAAVRVSATGPAPTDALPANKEPSHRSVRPSRLHALARSAEPSGARPCSASPSACGEGLGGGNEDVVQLDWPALCERVAACTLCGLHTTRTQTVFGVGSRTADWLFIGEAPGVDEDRQGEPFVGRAGQLLNNMLRAIGLSREQVYIANILKCRPPKNRDPRPEEAHACEPYLKRQIELLHPKIIIALGRIAAQNLLHTDTPIGRMRGRQYVYVDTAIPVLVTYHPAYLLRSPIDKRKAWEDLMLAQKLVHESNSSVFPR